MGLYDQNMLEKQHKITVHCFGEDGTIFAKHLIYCTSKNLVGSRGYPGYPRDPESLDLVLMSPHSLVLIPRSGR